MCRAPHTSSFHLACAIHHSLSMHQDLFAIFTQTKPKNGSMIKYLLIDWVTPGWTRKYFALIVHGVWIGPREVRSVRRDLEPNIIPSGPPTQLGSTY